MGWHTVWPESLIIFRLLSVTQTYETFVTIPNSSTFTPRSLEAIGDVAVTKRHQRLDEILIFLAAHLGNRQSCLQENSVGRMVYETRVRIYNKRMLIAQDCVKFRGRIA